MYIKFCVMVILFLTLRTLKIYPVYFLSSILRSPEHLGKCRLLRVVKSINKVKFYFSQSKTLFEHFFLNTSIQPTSPCKDQLSNNKAKV
jgi:hypothetical protein